MKVFSAFITVFMTIVASLAIFVASLMFGSTLFSLIVGIFVSVATISKILIVMLILPSEMADDAYRQETIRQLRGY
tara:strand:- start:241 stop:468 length:228 start_codon:yes stop_codon:yes gene_type:complete